VNSLSSNSSQLSPIPFSIHINSPICPTVLFPVYQDLPEKIHSIYLN